MLSALIFTVENLASFFFSPFFWEKGGGGGRGCGHSNGRFFLPTPILYIIKYSDGINLDCSKRHVAISQ